MKTQPTIAKPFTITYIEPTADSISWDVALEAYWTATKELQEAQEAYAAAIARLHVLEPISGRK